jgi:hypothetical protein
VKRRKFLGVGGQTPHPPKISYANPSPPPGESTVKISARKSENEVSWRGMKVIAKLRVSVRKNVENATVGPIALNKSAHKHHVARS